MLEGVVSRNTLLFADDMVILGKLQEDSPHSLNLLYSYCSKLGIEVNTNKTKIPVFRKRGKVEPLERWYHNNTEIEVLDSFNYVGVDLNYTGPFDLNIECIVGKI